MNPRLRSRIAKLIVWDADRTCALGRLRLALAEIRVAGGGQQHTFLSCLASCPALRQCGPRYWLHRAPANLLFSYTRADSRDVVGLIAALGELLRRGERAREAALRSSDPIRPGHAPGRLADVIPATPQPGFPGTVMARSKCKCSATRSDGYSRSRAFATVVCGHRQSGRDPR